MVKFRVVLKNGVTVDFYADDFDYHDLEGGRVLIFRDDNGEFVATVKYEDFAAAFIIREAS